ncbi:MAG TPA: hypothetical protein VIT44_11540 [Cyclobacteriaceae bacterium]
MIYLLPAYYETLVLPIDTEEVFNRLGQTTSNEVDREKTIYFNGWVREDRFRISIRQRRPSNYIPVVIGEIESTSRGSIIFMRYQLLPAVRLFLTFWSLLILMGSIFVGFQYASIVYLFSGIGILAVIHLIVWSNFKLQLKPTRELILEVLS